MKTPKQILMAGAVLTGMGVVIGAFGAHALEGILEENGRTATFETGVKFQFYHGLGLLLLGVIAERRAHPWVRGAAVWLLIGTLIFSISLYILSLTNIGWLGAITPFGGTSMIIGWAMLTIGLWRSGN